MIASLWAKMWGFSSYYLLSMQNQYIYRVSNLIVFYHLRIFQRKTGSKPLLLVLSTTAHLPLCWSELLDCGLNWEWCNAQTWINAPKKTSGKTQLEKGFISLSKMSTRMLNKYNVHLPIESNKHDIVVFQIWRFRIEAYVLYILCEKCTAR